MSIFSFVFCVYGVIADKSLQNPALWNFYLMFSSKNFIVLGIKFRSLIHFALIFVYAFR